MGGAYVRIRPRPFWPTGLPARVIGILWVIVGRFAVMQASWIDIR